MTASSRVFISYAHVDQAAAFAIATMLDGLGLGVFVDRRAIPPGGSIPAMINAALGTADYVLVLWSAAAATSPWVEAECDAALFRDRKRETLLLVGRLDDTPQPPLLAPRRAFDGRGTLTAFINEIREFFGGELARGADVRGWAPRTASDPLARASRQEIRRVAQRCLDEAHLQAFLWDHALEPADVKGVSMAERIVWLLHEAEGAVGVEAFTAWLAAERRPCVTRTLQTIRRPPDDPDLEDPE